MCAMSMPALWRIHDVTEFEFHISQRDLGPLDQKQVDYRLYRGRTPTPTLQLRPVDVLGTKGSVTG
jgi:hypothetical protein